MPLRKTVKKLSLSYVLWGSLIIGSLGSFAWEASQRFDVFKQLWHNYNKNASSFNYNLERLQAEVGYGGFIHHFKNMILRKDPVYIAKAEEKLENLFHTISTLKSYDLNSDETAALTKFENVFKEYKSKFLLAQGMIKDGSSSEQIDRVAKVDDTEAFKALNHLRTLIYLKNQRFIQTSDEQFANASAFLTIGLVVVCTACFFILLLLRREQKQLQDIQKTSDQLKSFIEAAPEAILVVNEHSQIETANPKACLLLGYSKDELEKQPIDRLFSAKIQKIRRRAHDSFMRDVEDKEIWQREMTLFTNEGRKFDAEIIISRTSLNSRKVAITTIRDISNHVRKHKALSAQAKHFETMATQDPLTCCLNRRGFDVKAQNILTNKADCSCIALDIDHFKKINDTYGHAAGDMVLKEFCTRIKEGLRDKDILCRMGGEEFVILLPQSSLGNTRDIAERIRFNIEQEPFELDGTYIQVTTSAGVAAYVYNEDDLNSLIERTDKALYRAKENGRNCVMTA